MKVLYVSGGSAGHLAPLVAVEKEIKKLHPDAESLFICSEKPDDAAYLRHEDVSCIQVPQPRRNLRLISNFLRNYRVSKTALRSFKPDVVFSKGGAVSIPACLAAKHLKIPIVLHESDAVMGRGNRVVARWATRVCVGFPQTTDGGRRAHNPTITGNPVRPFITQGKHEEGLRITRLNGKKPVLLVFGGSQGAEALNSAVRNHIDALLQHCDVVHLTGKGKKGASPRAGYWSSEFAYEEMPHLYAIADMALARAGAGTISELAANGIPAVLVPIRGLANDHQCKNATMAQENGGCILLLQSDLEQKIVGVIQKLSSNPSDRLKIRQSMKKIHQPDASRRIALIIEECIAQAAVTH